MPGAISDHDVATSLREQTYIKKGPSFCETSGARDQQSKSCLCVSDPNCYYNPEACDPKMMKHVWNCCPANCEWSSVVVGYVRMQKVLVVVSHVGTESDHAPVSIVC